MNAATDLERYVAAAARGDHEAFARLVESTSGMVTSISLAILRDLEQSRDVAQDVFLAAWKDLARLRNPASFLPWLRQTTRNRSHDALRSKVRRRRTFEDTLEDDVEALVADPGPDAATALIDDEARRALARAIDDLPDETREVVVLFYREERSVKQVSSLLELSEDAVRQRLSRARTRLRESVLDALGATLRRTAPGAAFTTLVLGALSAAAPPTAAAASVSTASGKSGAAKLTALFGGAALGGLVGMLPFVVNYRRMIGAARDDEERRGLKRFAMAGCALVAFVAAGFAVLPEASGAAIGLFALFGLALGLMQWGWLPRIIGRRQAAEESADPSAAARHRRQRLLGALGWLAGVLCGGGALVWAHFARSR